MIEISKLKNKEFVKNIRKTDSIVIDSKSRFIKTYKAKEKNLKIENKGKFIDMKLLSPYHKMFSAGKNVLVAEIKLVDWNGRNNLFDELKFYDKIHFDKKEKQFTFKWCEEKTIKMELSDDFPEQAKDNKVFEKVVGDWDNAIEFSKLDELPHKNIRIGIFTETILGEKIEWLPTIDGFDIYEWADYDVSELHELEHDTVNGTNNSLVMIDTTHFILAYRGDGSDGYIKTFSINGSYEITELHELEHDTDYGGYNSLVMIDTTHFILAYTGDGSDGFIKTFSVEADVALSTSNFLLLF